MAVSRDDEKFLAEFFAKSFHEVVIPALEDMEERLASKEDLGRLERKVDALYDRGDRHGKQLANHDERITDLEKKATFAS